jgi:hydroxyacyl-ACP dehydratase HTD2-like protein with hotdog domain
MTLRLLSRRASSLSWRGPATTRCRRYLSNETHVDVPALKARELPVIFDNLDTGPAQLLRSIVNDHLLPKQNAVNPDDATIQTTRYPDAPWHPSQLDPGFHLAYFPTSTSESELFPDGTDILHAPDRTWQYRLWAGGRIDFHAPIALRAKHMLRERIADVKIRGPRVFVRIERSMIHVSYSKRQHLKQVTHSSRDYTNQAPLTPRDLAQDPSLQHLTQRSPSLVESRWLCFMRDKPSQLDRPIRRARSPTQQPLLSLKMTPSPALLFRFSALSWNAHAIHLDRQYAQEVYGLRERLVHGPLTAVLLLSAARMALQGGGRRSSLDGHGQKGAFLWQTRISSLEYKNHAPLYLGEPIVVACAAVEERTLASGATQRIMHLWIARDAAGQQGEEDVCVTGTVELA